MRIQQSSNKRKKQTSDILSQTRGGATASGTLHFSLSATAAEVAMQGVPAGFASTGVSEESDDDDNNSGSVDTPAACPSNGASDTELIRGVPGPRPPLTPGSSAPQSGPPGGPPAAPVSSSTVMPDRWLPASDYTSNRPAEDPLSSSHFTSPQLLAPVMEVKLLVALWRFAQIQISAHKWGLLNGSWVHWASWGTRV